MNLLKKVKRSNHATIYNEILKRKAKRKGQTYKKFFFELLKKCKKQKNYCSRLYKKECKKFFSNLDLSEICDNKTFQKTIQHFFLEKPKKKITFVDEDEVVVSDDQLIS